MFDSTYISVMDVASVDFMAKGPLDAASDIKTYTHDITIKTKSGTTLRVTLFSDKPLSLTTTHPEDDEGENRWTR